MIRVIAFIQLSGFCYISTRTSCNVQGECDDNEDDENRRDEFCAPNPQPLFFPGGVNLKRFFGEKFGSVRDRL